MNDVEIIERPKPAQDEKGRFVSGNIGHGRYKGSRNKLGEAFLDDLYADWQQHGVSVIETVRAEKPDQYLKVVASILPKELNLRVNDFDDMSDAELIRQLASLAAELARAGAHIGAGIAAQEGDSAGTGELAQLH